MGFLATAMSWFQRLELKKRKCVLNRSAVDRNNFMSGDKLKMRESHYSSTNNPLIPQSTVIIMTYRKWGSIGLCSNILDW